MPASVGVPAVAVLRMSTDAPYKTRDRRHPKFPHPGRALLALLLCCCALPLAAQEPEPPEKPPEKPPEQPAGDTLERLIYVPYKNFKATLDKQGGAAVFLPYAEFLKLWEAAHQRAAQAAPPVGAVITEANYTGNIENNLARITAKYKIQALDKPWAEIPLRFGDAAVGKMTADNENVLLRATGDGTYGLLLPAKGTYNVELELVTKVKAATEGKSFELEVPNVGITTFELSVPAPDQTVEVQPHLTSTPLDADANSTRIQAKLGATPRLSARWFPRVSKTPDMELLASVTNQLAVRVADGLVHTDAVLTYQVLRGQLNQIRIAAPLGHRILDVAAPNLKGWKAEQEANRQVLVLELLGDAARTIPVEIHTERPVSAEPFEVAGIAEDGTVHGLHAIGAVRESGTLVVSHAPDLALTVEQQSGLIRIDAADVAEALRKPNSLFYKFYSPQFRLSAAVKPVAPQLQVQSTTTLEFRDDELRTASTFFYQIERAGVFDLRFTLPDGYKIDQVDCPQRKEHSISADGKTLQVTLNETTRGAVNVTIRGHVDIPTGQAETAVTLPLVEPLGVERELGTIHVFAPEALEIVSDEKKVVSAQPDRGASVAPPANLRLAASWTFNRRPVEIPVTILRKPTRLTATVATTITVLPETAEVVTTLDYLVQYAGIDTFRFQVPAAFSDRMEINIVPEDGGPAIKQRSVEGEPADGWVTRVVVLQREVLGRQRIVLKYDVPVAAGEGDKAGIGRVVLEPARVLGLAPKAAAEEDGDDDGNQPPPEAAAPILRLGEIVVQKDRTLSITATPTGLEAIDVRELQHLPQDGYLAYRYTKQPVTLELTSTKPEIQEVVETVASKALVEIVIGQDGQTTYRCRYVVQSSERQRLAVAVPKGAEILGTLMDRRQVNLEKAPDAADEGFDLFYVNVARTTRSDESFTLTLLFRLKTDVFQQAAWGGELEMTLPQLGGVNATTVAVQQLQVAVWVPLEFGLVGRPPHFTPETHRPMEAVLLGEDCGLKQTDHLDHWIGSTESGLFDFPRQGHAFVYSNLGGATRLQVDWWRTNRVTWVLSVAVFLIGLVLVKTSWENKLGILLIAGLLFTLGALSDAESAQYFAAAARFGLAAGLAWWFIHFLLQAGSRLSAPPPTRIPVGATVPAVIPPPGIFEPEQPKQPDNDKNS